MQDPLSQQLLWRNKPLNVLIIKKLGDYLQEEFRNIIKYFVFVSFLQNIHIYSKFNLLKIFLTFLKKVS